MQTELTTFQILGLILGPSGVVTIVAPIVIKAVLNGSKEKIAETKVMVEKGFKEVAEEQKGTRVAINRLHQRVDALELESAHEKGRQEGLAEGLAKAMAIREGHP